MALVWAEPFDQYGGTGSLVVNSGYTAANFNNVSSPGRTGTYCMNTNGSGFLTRPLLTTATTLGQGWAIAPQNFSGSNNDFNSDGARWFSAGQTIELNVVCMPDFSIGVYDRTNAFKGSTPPLRIVANSFTWIEAKAIGNTGGANTGSVEVRVNGVSYLTVNGINLPNAFAYHGLGGFAAGNCYFDDWIVWDNTGTKNNNFMGDRRLDLELPNSNGALQDFTASAGNAWDCLNNIPPVDTTYVEGTAAGNISEFGSTGIGIASNDIAAVVVCARMFKTDAGTASGRIGLNSAGNVNNSAELFPGTTGSFFYYPIENDPNGNVAWTQAAVNAASRRITRVQ